jgi:hypothetical protein
MGSIIDKSKALNDSFSFTLQNIDNNERQIELFFLGRTNEYTPKDMGFAIDTSNNFSTAYDDLASICIQNPNKPYPIGTSDEDCILNTQPSILKIKMINENANSQEVLTDGSNINLGQLNEYIQLLYRSMINNGNESGSGSIQLQFNATPDGTYNNTSIGMYQIFDTGDLGNIIILIRLYYNGDDEYGQPTYLYVINSGVSATLSYDYGVSSWKFNFIGPSIDDVYYSNNLISSDWDGTPSPDTPSPLYTTFDYQDLPYYCAVDSSERASVLPTWLEGQDVDTEVPPIWFGGGVINFLWGTLLGAGDGWYITTDSDEGFITSGVTINELPTGSITLNNSTIYNSEGLCTINLPKWDATSFKLVIAKNEESGFATRTEIQQILIQDDTEKTTLVDFDNISDWYNSSASIKEIANDVIIASNGGLTYKEIQRSQNGEFLHLRAISVQVLSSSASSIYTQNAQNLNSLGFNKNNPFGKDYIQYLNPTISPFQTQNVVNDIKINKNSEIFVLDGDTTFLYTLNPLTSVEITFNYVKFPMLLLRYGWQEAKKIIREKEEQQDVINENYDSRKDYEISEKESNKILNYSKNQ